MTGETTPSDRVPVDRPNIADLVFVFTMFVVLSNASKGLLEDPGLGWHLRNIDAMRAEGWWLTKDPFTHPRGEEPRTWYANQWLGEAPFYLGWKLAGLEGIAAVSAVIIAIIARYLYRIFIHDGLPWPMAVAWAALAALGTSCSWVARPNLFTILFVLITARTIVLFHEGRLTRRATLWLLPLFTIWANTHAGFLAGFIVVGLALVAQALVAIGSFDDGARQAARARAIHLTLMLAGLFAATLINPYGIGLYRHAFGLLGDDYFMKLHQEWKSPDFRSAGAMRYELLILLFPLLLGLTRRRPTLLELMLSVAWLHLALTGFRYVALWVVVAAPMMARASMEIPYLLELARRWNLTAEQGSLFFTRVGRAPWLWSMAFAVGVCVWAYAAQGHIRPQQKIVASKTLDEFISVAREWKRNHGRSPVLFHAYDWGGYITWRGWPDLYNWVDDRNEVQGRERVEEYLAIINAQAGWEQKLAGVDLICIGAGEMLAERLAERPQTWRKVEWPKDDGLAVIYERR